MSDLQELCQALEALDRDILSVASQLHSRAQQLGRAAGAVGSAARQADGNGAAMTRVTTAFTAASRHCAQAAVLLAQAGQEGQAFVQRTVATGAGAAASGVFASRTAQNSGAAFPVDLSVNQAEFVGAEFRTTAGSAFFYADDLTFRESANDVPPYPGEYVLDVHGTPSSVELQDSDRQWRGLSAHEFAEVVRRTAWHGEPVRLFSCYTGQDVNGFAQQLADELGVPVTAPTAPVSTVRDGLGHVLEPVVAEVEEFFDPVLGGWRTRFVPPGGEWRRFEPSMKGS